MACLNLWRCGAPDCDSTAVGVGGAIGLRAIGWWFEGGAEPLCPSHRPDGTLSRRQDMRCDVQGPCGHCAAEKEADRFQLDIVRTLGDKQCERYLKGKNEEWKPA